MSRVVAALDASTAAQPVLATAVALAGHLGAQVEAVHVLEGTAEAIRDLAASLVVPLRACSGAPVPVLVAAASEPDVVVLVLGARSRRDGPRPAGHVALACATRLDKPVVLVPPELAAPGRLERVIVALDDTEHKAAALRDTIVLARRCGLDVVVLHVHEEASLPFFEDQPQHELPSWSREFLVRNCPHAHELRLERRVGRASELLLRVACELEADLIALGWSRRLEPGRATVVRETLAASAVSVMLVPLRAGS